MHKVFTDAMDKSVESMKQDASEQSLIKKVINRAYVRGLISVSEMNAALDEYYLIKKVGV